MAAGTVTMAKKKPGSQESQADLGYETIRLTGDVARMARIIVAVHGGQIGKLISDEVRPRLTEIIRQIEKEGLLPK